MGVPSPRTAKDRTEAGNGFWLRHWHDAPLAGGHSSGEAGGWAGHIGRIAGCCPRISRRPACGTRYSRQICSSTGPRFGFLQWCIPSYPGGGATRSGGLRLSLPSARWHLCDVGKQPVESHAVLCHETFGNRSECNSAIACGVAPACRFRFQADSDRLFVFLPRVSWMASSVGELADQGAIGRSVPDPRPQDVTMWRKLSLGPGDKAVVATLEELTSE